jgi:hypothetical protein
MKTTTTTTKNNKSSSSSSSRSGRAERLYLSCTTKPGHHSRWFDAHASKTVTPLFEEGFGRGACKADIRGLNIKYLICLSKREEEEGVEKTIAAALVEQKYSGVVKVHGLCVAKEHRCYGHGTLLMAAIPTLLPKVSTEVIELCIDTGRPQTARLQAWYTRLGYVETASSDETAICMRRRLVPFRYEDYAPDTPEQRRLDAEEYED